MDFSKMTVAKLKEYAEENSIDLGSAKTKTAILSAITQTTSNISAPENVIGSTTITNEKRTPKSNTRPDDNNVTTVSSADTFRNKEFKKESNMQVGNIPIYSDKNMYWNGVGRITKGYNIVTKEAAEKWLSRKGIRKANAEEVASYYGL